MLLYQKQKRNPTNGKIWWHSFFVYICILRKRKLCSCLLRRLLCLFLPYSAYKFLCYFIKSYSKHNDTPQNNTGRRHKDMLLSIHTANNRKLAAEQGSIYCRWGGAAVSWSLMWKYASQPHDCVAAGTINASWRLTDLIKDAHTEWSYSFNDEINGCYFPLCASTPVASRPASMPELNYWLGVTASYGRRLHFSYLLC